MANYNHVVLMGNLTRDPELKYTNSGEPVAKVTMAINHKWTGKDQQVHEEVTFVDVDAFGRTAENVTRFLTKGSPLLVEGRMKQDRWENDKGEKRQRMKVHAFSFQVLSRGPGNTDGPGAGERVVRGAVATSRPAARSPRGGRRAQEDADDFDVNLPDPDFSNTKADEEEITVEVN